MSNTVQSYDFSIIFIQLFVTLTYASRSQSYTIDAYILVTEKYYEFVRVDGEEPYLIRYEAHDAHFEKLVRPPKESLRTVDAWFSVELLTDSTATLFDDKGPDDLITGNFTGTSGVFPEFVAHQLTFEAMFFAREGGQLPAAVQREERDRPCERLFRMSSLTVSDALLPNSDAVLCLDRVYLGGATGDPPNIRAYHVDVGDFKDFSVRAIFARTVTDPEDSWISFGWDNVHTVTLPSGVTSLMVWLESGVGRVLYQIILSPDPLKWKTVALPTPPELTAVLSTALFEKNEPALLIARKNQVTLVRYKNEEFDTRNTIALSDTKLENAERLWAHRYWLPRDDGRDLIVAAMHFDGQLHIVEHRCGTCSDGVQNGDETSIDCGGLKCDACVTQTTMSSLPVTTSVASDGATTPSVSIMTTDEQISSPKSTFEVRDEDNTALLAQIIGATVLVCAIVALGVVCVLCRRRRGRATINATHGDARRRNETYSRAVELRGVRSRSGTASAASSAELRRHTARKLSLASADVRSPYATVGLKLGGDNEAHIYEECTSPLDGSRPSRRGTRRNVYDAVGGSSHSRRGSRAQRNVYEDFRTPLDNGEKSNKSLSVYDTVMMARRPTYRPMYNYSSSAGSTATAGSGDTLGNN